MVHDDLKDKFVLLAGSAALEVVPEGLARAHSFVVLVIQQLLNAGAGVVVFGSEEPKNASGEPLVFDWTVLRTLDRVLDSVPLVTAPRAIVVTSPKALERKICKKDKELLSRLGKKGAIEYVIIPDDLHTGGSIVAAQVRRADAMIALGGGKGIAVRAAELRLRGCPVVPLGIDLGALSKDGEGAAKLYRDVLEEPGRYFSYDESKTRLTFVDLALGLGVDRFDELAERLVTLLSYELAPARRLGKQVGNAQKSAPPRLALIMRGGGAKGIAFVGALGELSPFFKFDMFVGASAGAITAILLASGYDSKALEKILWEKDFSEFLDASLLRAAMNLLAKGGLFPGDTFVIWMSGLLSSKIGRGDVRLVDLPARVLVYAADAGKGTIRFDGRGESAHVEAAHAARLSMSIPYLFVPRDAGSGRRGYDGGVLHNFPIIDFARQFPESAFVGLCLGRSRPSPHRRRPIFLELLRLWTEQDEQQTIDDFRDQVVMIDPEPIGTADFRLSEDEKAHLILQGRLAARHFLMAKRLGGAAAQSELDALAAEAASMKANVVSFRRDRKIARLKAALMVGTLLVVAALVALFVVHH